MHACSEEGLEFLGQPIEIVEPFEDLPKVAINVQLGDASMEEIESEIESSDCFLALTENHKVQKNQALQPLPVTDPRAADQKHLTFLNYPLSRALQTQINQEVVVAVVDTGIDYDHVDLKARMWKDANGSYGYNYVSKNTDPLDDDNHGTHVAGIVGAIENNAFMGAGLTGDYVRLMAVKVLNSDGAGFSTDVYNGILYAIAKGADVINLSVESPEKNPMMEDAIFQATQSGVVVVGATGNQSSEITTRRPFAPAYLGPELGGMISVASVDTDSGSLSTFSNYSRVYAEIAAPGAETSIGGSGTTGGILSTVPNDQWARNKGTSQATPMVSAAAAMVIGFLKTKGISYTPDGIEQFIVNNGTVANNTLSPYISQGRVLNLGWLAQNLYNYVESSANPTFTGNESVQSNCFNL